MGQALRLAIHPAAADDCWRFAKSGYLSVVRRVNRQEVNMSLYARLMVNDQAIGHLYARRLDPVHPQGNDVCYYEWYLNINGKTLGSTEEQPLAHVFSDGAWALVARIVEAAGHGPQAG